VRHPNITSGQVRRADIVDMRLNGRERRRHPPLRLTPDITPRSAGQLASCRLAFDLNRRLWPGLLLPDLLTIKCPHDLPQLWHLLRRKSLPF
jgi:hypothetical protein